MTRHQAMITRIITTFTVFIGSLIYSGYGQGVPVNDSVYAMDVPPQPGEETWHFIEDLKAPLWTKHPWKMKSIGEGYANLSGGVKIKDFFNEPATRLATAYEDLRQFFKAGSVPLDKGIYTIETALVEGLIEEEFQVEVNSKGCRLLASDVEGIRRAIFYIEDKMLSLEGPFLPLGKIDRKPFMRRRISRCFFGPIKRFPRMRDELMDTINYYPDNYLNRLAHEGVNGLWLTVEFQDLCTTKFTPEAGVNAKQHLDKLSQTVAQCLRYGIRTYIFCIEPKAWDLNDPVLKRYPELGGATTYNKICFCPSSETAHQYLYESVNTIFKAVPELGGIINISHGERATTCLASVSSTGTIDEAHPINCPRCSKIPPWKVLYQSLSAMEEGMHAVSPKAELISWLYMPQPQNFYTDDPHVLGEWVYDIPAHTPKGVVLQFNFTSGVEQTRFGKLLVGGDYWLSDANPSDRFERIANVARKNETMVSAKIQTSNSHELATVPYLPVPSLLYKTFAAMRRLGVSYTMLCWYFGNYPGLMNQAAGMLSFENFPKDETSFLHDLASKYWHKKDVPAIIDAWKNFSTGYENYPLTNMFQYYGPMHDGPVWPLLLKPQDAVLSPTWQIGSSITRKPWPPSGDRIGESLGGVLSLKETLELCRRMSSSWDSGIAIFKRLEPGYTNEKDRILDIGVAKAVGIQLRSGYNILRFYMLREEMFRQNGKDRLIILKQLEDIIKEELALNKELVELCQNDSRLGFHSEAEGYKYYPERIQWRMKQLKGVLSNDVPELKKLINTNQLLFPEYTGKKPAGPLAYSVRSRGNLSLADNTWQSFSAGTKQSLLKWVSSYDEKNLYITVSDSSYSADSALSSPVANIQIRIEPRRLFPARRFTFIAKDMERSPVEKKSGVVYTTVRVPLEKIGLSFSDLHPVRLNIQVNKQKGDVSSWLVVHPLTSRLELGSDNPADLGWLMFR
ncbi:MAG: hypothetical protein ABIN89_07550 [Chitinophagaceae bacterium]